MVSRDNWRTPDFDVFPQSSICLTLPDDASVKQSLFGALYLLAQAENWTEVGTATPEVMAQTFADMIDNAEFGSALLPILSIYANIAITTAIPAGHVVCNGLTYNKADYPEAYDMISPIYKDTGTETFVVPNLIGRFMRGLETAFPIGTTGGADTVTLALSEIPAHTHTEVTAVAAVVTVGAGAPVPSAIPGVGVTGSAGGGGSHNNIPRFHSVRYWIILK